MSLKNYLNKLFNKSNSEKLSENWRTKSTNPKVLEVYRTVVDGQNIDTDYWLSGIGGGDLLYGFYYFASDDWQELITDLSNWTTDQLELFSYGFLDCSSGDKTTKLKERFEIIIPLLKLGKERGGDLIENISEEMAVIDLYFDFFSENVPDFIVKIKEILRLLNADKYYNDAILSIKEKIKVIEASKS